MSQTADCPRRESDCPRADCDQAPVRVEERVINDRKALVYWHGDFDSYCIEYPDGKTSAHTRASERPPAA